MGLHTSLKKLLFSTKLGRAVGLKYYSSTNPLFRSVEFETSSLCNRKCSYCPVTDYRRPPAYMETPVFYKMIADLKKINYSGALSFCFFSEPLLDKRLDQFVARVRAELPRCEIEIYSNGDLLTPGRFQALLNAGMDVIRVSQHDPDPPAEYVDNMNKIRGSAQAEHLAYSVKNENQPLFNRGGLVSVKNLAKRNFCDMDRMYIDYKGDATFCCMDYFTRHTFGNVALEDIVEIWNKPAYKAVRDKAKCGNWPLEICKVCSGTPEQSDI